MEPQSEFQQPKENGVNRRGFLRDIVEKVKVLSIFGFVDAVNNPPSLRPVEHQPEISPENEILEAFDSYLVLVDYYARELGAKRISLNDDLTLALHAIKEKIDTGYSDQVRRKGILMTERELEGRRQAVDSKVDELNIEDPRIEKWIRDVGNNSPAYVLAIESLEVLTMEDNMGGHALDGEAGIQSPLLDPTKAFTVLGHEAFHILNTLRVFELLRHYTIEEVVAFSKTSLSFAVTGLKKFMEIQTMHGKPIEIVNALVEFANPGHIAVLADGIEIDDRTLSQHETEQYGKPITNETMAGIFDPEYMEESLEHTRKILYALSICNMDPSLLTTREQRVYREGVIRQMIFNVNHTMLNPAYEKTPRDDRQSLRNLGLVFQGRVKKLFGLGGIEEFISSAEGVDLLNRFGLNPESLGEDWSVFHFDTLNTGKGKSHVKILTAGEDNYIASPVTEREVSLIGGTVIDTLGFRIFQGLGDELLMRLTDNRQLYSVSKVNKIKYKEVELVGSGNIIIGTPANPEITVIQGPLEMVDGKLFYRKNPDGSKLLIEIDGVELITCLLSRDGFVVPESRFDGEYAVTTFEFESQDGKLIRTLRLQNKKSKGIYLVPIDDEIIWDKIDRLKKDELSGEIKVPKVVKDESGLNVVRYPIEVSDSRGHKETFMI